MKVIRITPIYFSPESDVGGGVGFSQELAKIMGCYADTEVVIFVMEPGEVALSEKVTMQVVVLTPLFPRQEISN